MAVTLGDAVVHISGDDKKLSNSLDSAQRKTRGFISNLGGILNNAFGVALGNTIQQGFAKIDQAIRGAIATGFEAVASNEQLRLSYESLIASQFRAADSTMTMAEALTAAAPMAEELYRWTVKLGVKSPFGEEAISKSLQMAQGFKFNTQQAKELVQTLVDTAAATGRTGESMESATRALGQMNAKGKVSQEELNQLSEAGIDYISTLDKMGLGLDDVATGSVNATEFIQELLATLQGNFAGAAERQATSWAGLASTFQDITRIGLRELFSGVLEVLQPLAGAVTDAFSNPAVLNGMRMIGTTIGELITPAVEKLTRWFEALPEKISKVVLFLQQLKDELQGLSAADILAGLGPALDKLESDLALALDALDRAHVGMLEKLQKDIGAAGDELAKEMAEVAEKYAPEIAKVQQRINDATEDFNQRALDQAERFAKERTTLEKRQTKQISDQEEKLTELKRDHQKRRQKLAQDLMFAETEEQYLQIQQQLQQEDEKFNEQKTKTEQAGKEQQQAITDQLAEIEAEERKANERLTKDRQRAFRDMNQAMAEINAKKAEEEAKLQESYNKQVEMLQSRIEAENSAYEQQQQDLQNSFAQEMADLEAMTQARAAAIGQGLPHEIAQWANSISTGLATAKQAVIDFVNLGVIPLQAAFSNLRASGSTTWQELRDKAVSALAEIQATMDAARPTIEAWWRDHGNTVNTLIKINWDTLSSIFKNGFDALVATIRLGMALVRGDWEAAWTHLQTIVQANWDTVETIFTNAWTGLNTITMDSLNTFMSLFTDQDWASIGKSIWEGITGGLAEAAGGVRDDVEEAGEDLLDGIKNFFGIDSPSVLFRDQVGKQLAAGLGQGFQAGMGDVARKAQDALKGLTPGRLQPALATIRPVSLQQTNYLPAAPNGFDREGLLGEIDQRTLKLLLEVENA